MHHTRPRIDLNSTKGFCGFVPSSNEAYDTSVKTKLVVIDLNSSTLPNKPSTLMEKFVEFKNKEFNVGHGFGTWSQKVIGRL